MRPPFRESQVGERWFHLDRWWYCDTVDASEILRSPVDVVDIPWSIGFYTSKRWVFCCYSSGVYWIHLGDINESSSQGDEQKNIRNSKVRYTPENGRMAPYKGWMELFQWENISEPTIHFQGTFVSFPGSTPKKHTLFEQNPTDSLIDFYRFMFSIEQKKTPSTRKNCCSKNHIRHILRSWF